MDPWIRDLDFRLGGERLVMKPGEPGYFNANLPHSVANRGTVDRVHLVIDVGVNGWLRDKGEPFIVRLLLLISVF